MATRHSGPAHGEARARRSRVWVMAARLVLCGAILGVALAMQSGGEGPFALDAQDGLYLTLAFAFLATALYGMLHERLHASARFGVLQLATDVALVTALVYFSGGADSLFVFLYVLLPVYGVTLSGGRGAFVAALLGSCADGARLTATRLAWLPHYGEGPGGPFPVLLAQWAVQAGAMLLVSLLVSVLVRELERAGAELDESASQLHRVRSLHERTVESLMSGLLTTDLSERITSFNREAERITGARLSEVIGRELDWVLPGARGRVLDGSAEGQNPRLRERMAYRNRRGEELHLGLSGSVLRDEEGAPSGHVVIFQDVTSVVEMEDELRRSERLAAIGQLSANLAHEVRNPLAALSGSIQMLGAGDGAAGPKERARLMNIVLRETDRLNHLITDFLRYARPVAPSLEVVGVAAVVQEVLEMFEGAQPVGVDVKVNIDGDVGVVADADQLRQVLWNLCLNAAQAMPDGGRLTIRAARAGAGEVGVPQGAEAASRNEAVEGGANGVEICVSDTGVGIPPDVLDRVFDPFFTTKPDGTGLGLATVHRIVEGHRGTLRVESSVGSGTVVRIVLAAAGETG